MNPPQNSSERRATSIQPTLRTGRVFQPVFLTGTDYLSGGRDLDEQAAYAAAAWLEGANRNGSLITLFYPPLTAEEQGIARIEGWILGGVRTQEIS